MVSENQLLVIKGDGTKHIVPADAKRQIEIMNQYAKRPEEKMRIYPYDPDSPDTDPIEPKGNFTDAMTKVLNENEALKKELAKLKKQPTNNA